MPRKLSGGLSRQLSSVYIVEALHFLRQCFPSGSEVELVYKKLVDNFRHMLHSQYLKYLITWIFIWFPWQENASGVQQYRESKEKG